jgi:phosphatidylglycerophosphate synthase
MRVKKSLRQHKSDETGTAKDDQNFWQRLALRTRGIITPANAVTLIGLFLSVIGIMEIYAGHLVFGIVLLAVGRAFDVLDGLVAKATRTKSQVGEALDAGSDKIIAILILVVFAAKEIIPIVPLIVVLAYNALSAGCGIAAKLRGRELHSSISGKRATFVLWLALLSFVAAQAVSNSSVFIADVLRAGGYIFLLIFLILATDALIGYARHTFGLSHNKKYVDNDGPGRLIAGRVMRGYWRRKWLVVLSGLVVVIFLFSVYSIAASPYSSDSFVQTPFTTSYRDGQIILIEHYTPHIYHSWYMSTVAYLEQLVTVFWDRIRSPEEPPGNVQSIIANIHAQRFDPSKPYLISGDQFDGLYLRNLSTFYQDLLDPRTALSPVDWRNRERIALQSLAYGLSATQQLKFPVTTLLPISPRGVIAVNFWNYPSDTMFSLFEQIQSLENNPATRHATLLLQQQYKSGLLAAYQNYITTVRDPRTGLVRSNIHLSSARDSVQRQSSFYDNVILWKTEQLAAQLGFANISSNSLTALRQTIIRRYWNKSAGYFIDDMSKDGRNAYSSDWLIALPLGFLNPSNPADRSKLEQISVYIDKQHLASPLPIRYTTNTSTALVYQSRNRPVRANWSTDIRPACNEFSSCLAPGHCKRQGLS